jgi:hypothetical protein
MGKWSREARQDVASLWMRSAYRGRNPSGPRAPLVIPRRADPIRPSTASIFQFRLSRVREAERLQGSVGANEPRFGFL